MKDSANIFREHEREHHPSMRLYFMGEHRTPLVDPRDIPRGWHGHPEPEYEIKLRPRAIAEALAGSFVNAYMTGDFAAVLSGPEPAVVAPLPEVVDAEIEPPQLLLVA